MSSTTRSIIRRFLPIFGENELLNITRVVSHTKSTVFKVKSLQLVLHIFTLFLAKMIEWTFNYKKAFYHLKKSTFSHCEMAVLASLLPFLSNCGAFIQLPRSNSQPSWLINMRECLAILPDASDKLTPFWSQVRENSQTWSNKFIIFRSEILRNGH